MGNIKTKAYTAPVNPNDHTDDTTQPGGPPPPGSGPQSNPGPPTGGTGSGSAGGGGGTGTNGSSGAGKNPLGPAHSKVPMTTQYSGAATVGGGPQNGAMTTAGQSFSDPSRLQGAVPFWQTPQIQVASQHGYDPGQTYSGQAVTGSNIQSDPFVGAALANFNQNVAPGIQNQANTMGMGRSTAALDAMSKAQAALMPSLYNESAQLQQQQIQNQIQGGQFSAGLSQQDLSRLQGAVGSEEGIQQNQANLQQQGQQQLFQNLMQMQGQQNGQQLQGANQLFGQGTLAQQTGQQANTNSYNDYLRQQGLAESAVNPFGGISGLLGSVTTGK